MGSLRDTFRGTFNSTASRLSLYEKNAGEISLDTTGVMWRVDSPVSGSLLVAPTTNRPGVKDPISGTALKYMGRRAVVTAPASKQQFHFSKSFHLRKDVDVTIQTLRNTTKVNKYTNEKVGTAGSPTGLDKTLTAYKNVVGSS